MTSAIAPSAPAARLLRAAAGRRALQLALLCGGLLALGLLCGGRAHAADSSDGPLPAARATAGPLERVSGGLRLPTSGSTGDRVAHGDGVGSAQKSAQKSVRKSTQEPAQEPAREPVRESPQRPARESLQQSARKPVEGSAQKPVQKPVEKSGEKSGEKSVRTSVQRADAVVSEGVNRVQGGAVESVSRRAAGSAVTSVRGHLVRPLADTVRYTVRQVVEPVVEPVVAPVRVLVGQVREAGGEVVTAVVRPLPSGDAVLPRLPGVPGLSGDAEAEVPPASAGPAAPRPAEHEASEHAEGPRSGEAAVCGPVWFGDAAGAGANREAAARHSAVRPSAPSAPARPDGVPAANASVSDGGSTRHGDLHAAAFGSRVPVLLPPGATASGGGAPVADRQREIPEFPG
ncbi:hypothetical protein GTY65_30565 [Streptomyces sp. SID8379]|uniref:hypothetical protein n=1 Tax=unclassified Streptomyces TaxID=2593676 RepID=UPI00038166B9|nr:MULTISPECIES: hypothetical protein [unclassified Streptomyces]MYW68385.1 hypothetical protein [Streptomyces sp. SID8379]